MLTKGAIGNLINRYRAVLKKCNLINTFGSLAVASMLVLGGAGVAEAATLSLDTSKSLNADITGDLSGYLSSSSGSDRLTLEGRTVSEYVLKANGAVTGGLINVSAGDIDLGRYSSSKTNAFENNSISGETIHGGLIHGLKVRIAQNNKINNNTIAGTEINGGLIYALNQISKPESKIKTLEISGNTITATGDITGGLISGANGDYREEKVNYSNTPI